MRTTISDTFDAASAIDKSVTPSLDSLDRLKRTRISPSGYSRDLLFQAMADGKVVIFKDYPSPYVTNRDKRSKTQARPNEIAGYLSCCDTGRKHRVQVGPSQTYKYYDLREMLDKWAGRKAILSATDIHIRNTNIENVIDPSVLSKFNILCDCDDAAASLEMMTMVVSSKGNLTDSHSDDSDGSNHCFIGKKLWLAWDTHEGLEHGLQDVERVGVRDKARFNMQTFLSLRSACWFTVEQGQTLFCPGHLTHKVITLDHYLGVGSFYVALPNCLRTLSRWLLHGANWGHERGEENQNLVTDLSTKIRARYLRRRLSRSKKPDPWGADYLAYSLKSWERSYSPGNKRDLLADPRFKACFDIASTTADEIT